MAYFPPNDLVASGSITAANLNLTSGAPTAGSTVSISGLNGQNSVSFLLSGTYSANLIIQGSVDGSNWNTINLVVDKLNGGMTAQFPNNTAGVYMVDCSAYSAVRITAQSYTSGTASISMRASYAISSVAVEWNGTAAQNTQLDAFKALPVTLSNQNTQDLVITGQGGQTAINQNILLATAGTGAVDTASLAGIPSSGAGTQVGWFAARSFYCQIIPTGTVTGGAFLFEGSNDNTTFTVIPYYIDSGASGNYPPPFAGTQVTGATTLASTANFFCSGKIGYRYIRCRITSAVTGGGSLQAITRFSTADYIQFQEIESDYYVTGAATQTATVNNILTASSGTAATDLNGYRSFAVQVASTGTGGTFIFEGSNDNTNFVAVPVYNINLLTGVPINAAITATSSNIIYVGQCLFRYLRLRIATTITGGSIQAFSKFSAASLSSVVQSVANPTAANLNATVTATNLSTNVAQVGGTNTVNGGVAGTLAVGGNVAHSAASTANPLQMGGRVVPTTIATVDTSLVAGDVSYKPISSGLQAITKDYGTAELDYAVNFSSISTTTTVQQLVPASGTASVRNYVTALVVHGDTMGAAGVCWILDGALTVSSIAITTGLCTTSTAHDLKVGDAVVFTALAAGTGVSTNTVYYVTSVGSTTTFNFSTTVGGSNVVPSVAYTGTTMYRILFQQKLQTAAIGTPTLVQFLNPLRGNTNTPLNFLFPSSLTSGTLYLTVNGYRGF